MTYTNWKMEKLLKHKTSLKQTLFSRVQSIKNKKYAIFERKLK